MSCSGSKPSDQQVWRKSLVPKRQNIRVIHRRTYVSGDFRPKLTSKDTGIEPCRKNDRDALHHTIPSFDNLAIIVIEVHNAYAPFRDVYNYANGWARPDDPERSRTQQRTSESSERLASREAITDYIEQRTMADEITRRADLFEALHVVGLETPRQGKSYVTALDPETGERWRLKGRIYESGLAREKEFDRKIAGSFEAKQGHLTLLMLDEQLKLVNDLMQSSRDALNGFE